MRTGSMQFLFISGLGGALAACATGGDPAGDSATSSGSVVREGYHRDVGFAIRVEGVSGPHTLVLPDGTATAAPISPGLLAVATADRVVFQPGSLAGKAGLESLAEDGNPCPLVARLAKRDGVTDAEFIIPNLHYRVTAKRGDRLHFAVMFVHSNDLFYAFGPDGIPLFDAAGHPVSGDMTQYVSLWDAGTEQNQAPGVGPDQAPRQPAPGIGVNEREPVQLISDVHDGFSYPATASVIRITVTPDS